MPRAIAVARLVTQQRKLARYDTGEHAQYGRDQVVFERGDVAGHAV
jgi:hypothetical protein